MTPDPEPRERDHPRHRDGRVPHVALRLPAVPENLPLIRNTVAAFAAARGADGPLHGAVSLAVSEAVSNVILHAYPDGEPGIVRVEADVEDHELEIVVHDEGGGIASGPLRPGLGLGLAIIAEHTEELMISERAPRGTEVWMRFRLPQQPPEGRDG